MGKSEVEFLEDTVSALFEQLIVFDSSSSVEAEFSKNQQLSVLVLNINTVLKGTDVGAEKDKNSETKDLETKLLKSLKAVEQQVSAFEHFSSGDLHIRVLCKNIRLIFNDRRHRLRKIKRDNSKKSEKIESRKQIKASEEIHIQEQKELLANNNKNDCQRQRQRNQHQHQQNIDHSPPPLPEVIDSANPAPPPKSLDKAHDDFNFIVVEDPSFLHWSSKLYEERYRKKCGQPIQESEQSLMDKGFIVRTSTPLPLTKLPESKTNPILKEHDNSNTNTNANHKQMTKPGTSVIPQCTNKNPEERLNEFFKELGIKQRVNTMAIPTEQQSNAKLNSKVQNPTEIIIDNTHSGDSNSNSNSAEVIFQTEMGSNDLKYIDIDSHSKRHEIKDRRQQDKKNTEASLQALTFSDRLMKVNSNHQSIPCHIVGEHRRSHYQRGPNANMDFVSLSGSGFIFDRSFETRLIPKLIINHLERRPIFHGCGDIRFYGSNSNHHKF